LREDGNLYRGLALAGAFPWCKVTLFRALCQMFVN